MNNSHKNKKTNLKEWSSSGSIIEIGLAFHQKGQLELALEVYKTIKESEASYAESLHLIGVINLQKKEYSAAMDFIKKSIALKPNNPQAINNLASTYIKLENYDLALETYQNAIDLNPNFTDALFNKGNLLKKLDKIDDALDLYNLALNLNPTFTEALLNKGNLLREINKTNEAFECYKKAISINKNFAEAYYNSGLILNIQEKYEEAIKYFNEAIRISPNFSEAYSDLSISLSASNQFTEALAAANKAIAINPTHYEAYSNRGRVYGKINQHNKAINDFQYILKNDSTNPEAHFNLGNSFRDLKEIEKSLEHYEAAIKLRPDYVEAYWNAAHLHLLNGNYETGWKLYEWRWKWDGFSNQNRTFNKPPWSGGENLANKKVFIHSEQGLGDCIQFSFYINKIKDFGAEVIFEVYPELYSLFKNTFGESTLVIKGEEIPQFDYHCPLLSLPYALQSASIEIPNFYRYISPNSLNYNHWNERLGPKTKNRVGLVWSGSKLHKNDLNRSIPLEKLKPIISVSFEYICLQKEIKYEDTKHLHEFGILNLSNEIYDFEDTASICELVDLVITVDTSVAHLSCALEKPTWILLPFIPDWRWGLDGETSKWYPSAKLYRQTEDRSWDTVITRVSQDLELFNSHSRLTP